METLLILTLIALAALLFRRLYRQLDGEWPPVLEETAAPPRDEPTAASAQPTRAAIQAIPTPAPQSSPAITQPVAAQPVAAPPPPRPAAEPVIPTAAIAEPTPYAPPDAHAIRRAAVALAAGGGLLMLLSQLVGRALAPGERLPGFVLFFLGGLALLGGAQALRKGAFPGLIGRPLLWLARFARVAPTQAALLLLAPAYTWLARLAAGDGLLARHAVIAVLAWLAAIAFAVAGSWRREEGRRIPLDRRDFLWSALLFVVALALRAYQMSRFPDTYSGDEGSAGLFALEFLDGRVNNILTLGWFSFPSLYFTTQSAAITLFGQTIEAVRLTSAVAGSLTVVAVYWLGRTMFDRTTAVVAALYLAASHYHIHMSRIALNNVWDGLFGTLAILGLWYGWRSGRRIGFILCGLTLGLGQYFYVSIRLLPVLFLIWAAAAFWRQRAQFRERFAGLVMAAFIAFIVFLPLGLYFYNHTDEFQAPMNRVTIFGSWLEGELARGERTTAEIILDQAVDGALGFTHEPLRLLYDPGSPLLLAGAALLFLLGILWAALNFDLRYFLMLLPLLAAIFSNAISQDSPASQRYVMAMPLVALFIGVPIGQAAAWLNERYPRYRRAIPAAALVFIALIAAIDLDYYFNEVYDTYVLGDTNTRVATEIAYFLRDKEPAGQEVFFFGFPRMGYFSLSTIPFLAPDKRGQDIIEPLTAPPDMALGGPALFIFLPERLGELELVRQRFPDGDFREFNGPDRTLMFAVYEVGT